MIDSSKRTSDQARFRFQKLFIFSLAFEQKQPIGNFKKFVFSEEHLKTCIISGRANNLHRRREKTGYFEQFVTQTHTLTRSGAVMGKIEFSILIGWFLEKHKQIINRSCVVTYRVRHEFVTKLLSVKKHASLTNC